MNNHKEEIIKVMRASLVTRDVPLRYRREIVKAHFDRKWDFYEKSDGLTYFQDRKWINAYPPAFVWHDWRMQNMDRLREGVDRKVYVRNTNLELKKIMEIYGYSWLKVNLYPLLANIAWKKYKR